METCILFTDSWIPSDGCWWHVYSTTWDPGYLEPGWGCHPPDIKNVGHSSWVSCQWIGGICKRGSVVEVMLFYIVCLKGTLVWVVYYTVSLGFEQSWVKIGHCILCVQLHLKHCITKFPLRLGIIYTCFISAWRSDALLCMWGWDTLTCTAVHVSVSHPQ